MIIGRLLTKIMIMRHVLFDMWITRVKLPVNEVATSAMAFSVDPGIC